MSRTSNSAQGSKDAASQGLEELIDKASNLFNFEPKEEPNYPENDLDLEKRSDLVIQANLHALLDTIEAYKRVALIWLEGDHVYQADQSGRRIVRRATRARLYLGEVNVRVAQSVWKGDRPDSLQAKYDSLLAGIPSALEEVQIDDWLGHDSGVDTPSTSGGPLSPYSLASEQQSGESEHEPDYEGPDSLAGLSKRARSASASSRGGSQPPRQKKRIYTGHLHPEHAELQRESAHQSSRPPSSAASEKSE